MDLSKQESITKLIEGFIGENALRKLLIKKKYKFISPDLIIKINKDYYLSECKFQEIYNNFKGNTNRYGHGLPVLQYNNYLKMYDVFKLDTILFIFCTTNKKLYYNTLSSLRLKTKENKDFYLITKNGKRIVFDIALFKVSNDINEDDFNEYFDDNLEILKKFLSLFNCKDI